MEAPEKLYFEDDDPVLDLFSTKRTGNEVEYARTDAFIEKACNAYCKLCKMTNCRSNECKWVNDFKRIFRNYMKGE